MDLTLQVGLSLQAYGIFLLKSKNEKKENLFVYKKT